LPDAKGAARKEENPQLNGWRSAVNRARLLGYATALSTMVGWSLIAPRPAQAQLGSLIVTGTFMKEVDTYAPSPDPPHHSTFQAEHFKATSLADTSHTLTIEVTGQKDPAALRATGWIGYRGPQTGIARVILDGNIVADSLDTYFPGDVPQGAVFTLPGPAAGSHTLTIEVTGLKNPASAGASIVVDAFDVAP
jgi:VCBS repeat-containing protein